jgi:hypothetical protein
LAKKPLQQYNIFMKNHIVIILLLITSLVCITFVLLKNNIGAHVLINSVEPISAASTQRKGNTAGQLLENSGIKSMELLEADWATGNIDKAEWMLIWRDKTRNNWVEAIGHLNSGVYEDNCLDSTRFEGFVLGLNDAQISEVLNYGQKVLNHTALRFLYNYTFRRLINESVVNAMDKALELNDSGVLVSLAPQFASRLTKAEDLQAVFFDKVSKMNTSDQKSLGIGIAENIITKPGLSNDAVGNILVAGLSLIETESSRSLQAKEFLLLRSSAFPKSACEIALTSGVRDIAVAGTVAMTIWAKKDPIAAGEWLNSIVSSIKSDDNVDYLISGYACVAAGTSSSEAADSWIAKIKNAEIAALAEVLKSNALIGKF